MRDTDVQILCGCRPTTVCPQGKTHGVCGREQCVIVVPEDDLFRIVMELPEFNRRFTVEERAVEEEVQEKGLVAPRITPESIDAIIISEDYYVFPGTTLTVCCLTLENGFNVVGESASASPENFDEELGRKIARGHARDKIWALEGYRLKCLLFSVANRGEEE